MGSDCNLEPEATGFPGLEEIRPALSSLEPTFATRMTETVEALKACLLQIQSDPDTANYSGIAKQIKELLEFSNSCPSPADFAHPESQAIARALDGALRQSSSAKAKPQFRALIAMLEEMAEIPCNPPDGITDLEFRGARCLYQGLRQMAALEASAGDLRSWCREIEAIECQWRVGDAQQSPINLLKRILASMDRIDELAGAERKLIAAVEHAQSCGISSIWLREKTNAPAQVWEPLFSSLRMKSSTPSRVRLFDAAGYFRKALTSRIGDPQLAEQLGRPSPVEVSQILDRALADLCSQMKRIDMFADRMRFAPITSSGSFKLWSSSRKDLLEKMAGHLKRSLERLHVLGPIAVQIKQLSALQCAFDARPLPGMAEDDFIKLDRDLRAKGEQIGSEGELLIELVREEEQRLEIAHAAIPALPADWTKPAGHALVILACCAVCYVVAGYVKTQQPVWNLMSTTDALDLVIHPAYIISLIGLMTVVALAARRVPEKHAVRTREKISKLLAGNIAAKERSIPLEDFNKRVQGAFIGAVACACFGMAMSWQWSAKAGGAMVSLAPFLTCNTDQRVFAFSKGFVSIKISEPRISQMVFTKDPALYLCSKLSDNPSRTPPDVKGASELKLSIATLQYTIETVNDGFAEALKALAILEELKELRGIRASIDRIPGRLSHSNSQVPVSIAEFRECNQSPASSSCALSPIYGELVQLSSAVAQFSNKLDSANEHLAEIDESSKRMVPVNNALQLMVKEWNRYKARHIARRAWHAITGDKD